MSVTLNRKKVMEYVEKYWDDRNLDEANNLSDIPINQRKVNPNFFYYKGHDCTNFVSQCWNYGGITQTNKWKPYDAITGRTLGTPSWTVVDDFTEYFTTGDNPIAEIKWSSNEAKVGDIIQFYNPDDGWHHAGIVSGFDPKWGMTYAAHSKGAFRRPLSDVYPHIETMVRFICPKSAVNE